jgi:hypothetical protein
VPHEDEEGETDLIVTDDGVKVDLAATTNAIEESTGDDEITGGAEDSGEESNIE